MMFGDPKDFAIEAMVEPDLPVPSAVWGRMRVWCQGVALGDYEVSYCALYPAYLSFTELQQALPTLWHPALEELTDAELLNLLDGLLYGHHGDVEVEDDRSLEQVLKDVHEYGKFNFLTNWGEQFDGGGKSFIICKDGQTVKVLNRSLPPNYGLSLNATRPAVEDAISRFRKWFDSEAVRLSGENA